MRGRELLEGGGVDDGGAVDDDGARGTALVAVEEGVGDRGGEVIPLAPASLRIWSATMESSFPLKRPPRAVRPARAAHSRRTLLRGPSRVYGVSGIKRPRRLSYISRFRRGFSGNVSYVSLSSL